MDPFVDSPSSQSGEQVGDANINTTQLETTESVVEGAQTVGKQRRKLTSEGFDDFENVEFTFSAQKTQFELYLDEPKLDRNKNLDVLEYWKANHFRFQELSVMAHDVPSIPISMVALESAFSVGGRVLDQYRSALMSEIVEAVICTRDWIFGDGGAGTLSPILEDFTEDISNLEISVTNSQFGECSTNIHMDV